MTYAHFLVMSVFASMAYLQLNDPDPIYWIIVYLGVAAIAGMRMLDQRFPRLTLLLLGMVIAGLLISLPGFTAYLDSGHYASLFAKMQASRPYIESAREFLGLLIAAITLALYVKSSSTKRPV